MKIFQTTLKKEVRFQGIGVHSGEDTLLLIKPAPENHNIIFVDRNEEGQEILIPANFSYVDNVSYCTRIGNGGTYIQTIEHIMATLAAFQLDNLRIEIKGREIPILDGSAEEFSKAFEAAGILEQKTPREYIRILKPVRVDFPSGYAEFKPFDGQRYDVSISFTSQHIQNQRYVFDLETENFVKDIAKSRTFGFRKDAEHLWKRGLALGSSLENSIVLDEEDQILNEKGLYYKDEFVRHKLLDAMGDTALLGKPFIGVFRSFCSGHQYNIKAVRALLQDKNAYEIVHFS